MSLLDGDCVRMYIFRSCFALHASEYVVVCADDCTMSSIVVLSYSVLLRSLALFLLVLDLAFGFPLTLVLNIFTCVCAHAFCLFVDILGWDLLVLRGV